VNIESIVSQMFLQQTCLSISYWHSPTISQA
jgi:hypothetical protein